MTEQNQTPDVTAEEDTEGHGGFRHRDDEDTEGHAKARDDGDDVEGHGGFRHRDDDGENDGEDNDTEGHARR